MRFALYFRPYVLYNIRRWKCEALSLATHPLTHSLMPIQRITPKYSWPKQLPVLSDEQKRAREDFMLHWHRVLPKKYGMIERFNHSGAFTEPIKPGTRTLEIGAG